MSKLAAALLCGALTMSVCTVANSATTNKSLKRVSGNVGYRATHGAPAVRIAGEQVLSNDTFALTENRSTGLVTLEDSSVVGLGQNTEVQLGAFDTAQNTPGSTIILQGGKLRFEIRHPQGGRANYHFVTPTATIAVRGTIGLISSDANGDTIVCVSCGPDDVVVTIKATGQVVPLSTGNVLQIHGNVSQVGNLTTEVTHEFEAAGLNAQSQNVADVFSGTLADRVATSAPPGAIAGIAVVAVGAVIAASNTTPTINRSAPGSGNIAITPNSLTLQPGGQQSLSVENGATAFSSNPSLLSVSGVGPTLLVHALASGSATIEVRGPSGMQRISVVIVGPSNGRSPIR
ncbi:MAG: FecR domain-containing protein [Candidatus Eremiobacteraeota bacterium]|nr:FecR domain-containing protein [Candidatus Eremiobacteraeota bacterium]